ncbi:MAG: hypothetical protein RL459_1631 [Pseudomonadota bacterium]|jgi:hypothetical protein
MTHSSNQPLPPATSTLAQETRMRGVLDKGVGTGIGIGIGTIEQFAGKTGLAQMQAVLP